MMRSDNTILTGLPRSGTTLLCNLLNRIPNSVALHEPMAVNKLAPMTPEEALDAIGQFFDAQRRMIRTRGVAVSRSVNGIVPQNSLGDAASGEVRPRLIDGNQIIVDNVDSDSFRLYVKHPSYFSAFLPFLTKRFVCFASVRNPLAVLLSWQSSGMSVAGGRVPAAEAIAPDLKRRLDDEQDTLDRQIILLDFFFGRFAEFLPGRTIRYEDVVATGGKALGAIDPRARDLDVDLRSRNRASRMPLDEVRRIAEALLGSENACWKFYARGDVEDVLADLERDCAPARIG
jgi:hypothetical protein